jgi:hypothetical protein
VDDWATNEEEAGRESFLLWVSNLSQNALTVHLWGYIRAPCE